MSWITISEKKWPKAVGLGALLAAIVGVGVWLAWPEPLPKAYAKVEAAAPDDKLEALSGDTGTLAEWALDIDV